MKWFIITDSAYTGADIQKVIAESDKKADFSVFSAEKDRIEDFSQLLENTTHCIVLLAGKKSCTPDISFMVGYFSGRHIPVFTNFEFIAGGNRLGADVSYFETVQLLESYIAANCTTLEKNLVKKESYEYLFKAGIPFTASCFGSFIAKDRLDVCEKYVNAGMDVNSRDRDGTPMLNIATRNDQKECIGWLLDRGADINAVSLDRGYTALMDAVWRGNTETAELLIEKGAALNTVNKEGQTMLVLAVGAGRTELCRMLAEHGENPDVRDSMGMSAYEYAKLFQKKDIAELLEKYHKK